MSWRIIHADVLDGLAQIPGESVQTCITSPPYWGLRDYGEEGQLGLESTPEEYVEKMVAVFRDVRRVLRDDGTVWLNLGDSYNSTSGYSRASNGWEREGRRGGSADKKEIDHPILKTKDLVGIPWRVAFALQADGWWLRSDIVWSKPNPMPESVTDRPTKAHEYIFLLAKSQKYYYDHEAIREDPKPDNKGMMRAPKCSPDRPKYDTLADDSGNVTVKQSSVPSGTSLRNHSLRHTLLSTRPS